MLIARKLHITCSFAIQRITWKICLGIIFLENLFSATWNCVFGINFAIVSGWRLVFCYGFSSLTMNHSICARWAVWACFTSCRCSSRPWLKWECPHKPLENPNRPRPPQSRVLAANPGGEEGFMQSTRIKLRQKGAYHSKAPVRGWATNLKSSILWKLLFTGS